MTTACFPPTLGVQHRWALAEEWMRRNKPSKAGNSEDVLPGDMECPTCGAWESQGGCEDPSACAQALAQKETEYLREMAKLLGRKAELVDRCAVERSRNYIRRRHILGTAEPIYVER